MKTQSDAYIDIPNGFRMLAHVASILWIGRMAVDAYGSYMRGSAPLWVAALLTFVPIIAGQVVVRSFFPKRRRAAGE